MYAVSDAFKAAIQDNTRSYYWTGKITLTDGTEYPFENRDIVKGSGYVTRQCCANNEIELGSVYAAEIGITLFTSIDRYSLTGATITLSFHLDIGSGNYEEVPMGVFEISEANRTIKCLEIKAYDYMLRFDKTFDPTVTSGSAYDLMALAGETCKVELAQTQEELEALPNGSILLGVYMENDIETWRDLLYYVAQALGGFMQIDRSGKLKFVKYGNTAVVDIPNTQRFSSSFSDFITRYTAVNSMNVRTGIAEYYALDPDDGLTLELGSNPLLQFGLAETRKTLLTNILNGLSVIRYVPFDSTTIGNPALDPGDVITFSGGQADASQISAVTGITLKVNGRHTLKCVGKNPRLTSAKSKSDKNYASLVNQIEAGKIITHSFINASKYTVSETPTEIISIEFASNEDTSAQFFAVVLLELTAVKVEKKGTAAGKISIPAATEGGDPTEVDVSIPVTLSDDGEVIIEVTYVLNDNEITTFTPIETWGSGKHILNLYYPLDSLTAGAYNTFRVLMKVTGGSSIVERSSAIATISGQGLSAAAVWDGRLSFEETTYIPALSGFPFATFNDVPLVQIDSPIAPVIYENIPDFSFGVLSFRPFSDNIAVNPVVVSETINTADKDKMSYSTDYVIVGTQFLQNTSYSFKSAEQTIDSGRMCSIEINSEQFDHISGIEVE